MRKSILLMVALMLVVGGCGDDDERVQKAIERCENFLDVWCEKSANTCSHSTYDQCDTASRQVLNCGDATDTTHNYDRCIREIKSADCSVADTVPASCLGVIVMDEE